jgi:AcrR family transcriptional regulator
MRRRAEQMDETRQRIVEAAVQLHGTVGPAATTIAAIAGLAGVTRLTVYRHFPDEAALFGACSAHWLSRQQLPDPDAWSRTGDPAGRLRAGLADLYRFYRADAGMLANVYRDFTTLPGAQQQFLRDQDSRFRRVLAEPFPANPGQTRRLQAVIGHATSFWTWHSLCVNEGLSDQEAVQAMVGLVLAAMPAPQAGPAPSGAAAARAGRTSR